MTVAATLWNAVAGPWSSPIMVRALADVVLLGVAGGALGCWIVLYEVAYGAESLAHALLPGLVLASLAGLPLLLGGGVGILVAAAAVALASRAPVVGRDAATGVVVAALVGLGALLALAPASPAGLERILFGDVLGVSGGDVGAAAALVAVVLAALRVLHRPLLASGFDRAGARALGVRTTAVDAALLALVAVAILVAVEGLGNLLVVAVLVGPAAAARLLARRVVPMMALAAAIAAIAALCGLYLSWYAGTAAGASIAGAMVLAYLIAAAVGHRAPAGGAA